MPLRKQTPQMELKLRRKTYSLLLFMSREDPTLCSFSASDISSLTLVFIPWADNWSCQGRLSLWVFHWRIPAGTKEHVVELEKERWPLRKELTLTAVGDLSIWAVWLLNLCPGGFSSSSIWSGGTESTFVSRVVWIQKDTLRISCWNKVWVDSDSCHQSKHFLML